MVASAASDLTAGAPSIRNGHGTTPQGEEGLMHFRRLQASCVGSRYEVGRSRGRVGCPNVLVRKSGSREPEPLPPGVAGRRLGRLLSHAPARSDSA